MRRIGNMGSEHYACQRSGKTANREGGWKSVLDMSGKRVRKQDGTTALNRTKDGGPCGTWKPTWLVKIF